MKTILVSEKNWKNKQQFNKQYKQEISPANTQSHGDNTAHPSDPACLGPLAAGECRTCLWEVPLAGVEDARATVVLTVFDRTASR